jgi:hypothetical protein
MVPDSYMMCSKHELRWGIEEEEHGKNTDHHRYYSHRPWPLLAIVTKTKSGSAAR